LKLLVNIVSDIRPKQFTDEVDKFMTLLFGMLCYKNN